MRSSTGNAHDDGVAHGGWFVGHFIAPADPRSTSVFEAKWYSCRRGEQRAGTQDGKDGISLVVLIAGRLRLVLEDDETVLSRPADYVLWWGASAHSWTAEADSVVLAVRAPSMP